MRTGWMLTGALAALVLVGCDNGPSAVETRDRTAETGAYSGLRMTSGPDVAPSETSGEAKPLVTANRRETADAKAVRLYERNGAAFGARSADDYVTKMRAFAANPPSGVDSAKRPNGDTLYYQASTNTFAVVARDGTPRTMFKPDDGPTYWAEQKDRAPTFGQRRDAG